MKFPYEGKLVILTQRFPFLICSKDVFWNYLHSFTCVIQLEYQVFGVPNLCLAKIISAKGNMPTPLEKKIHFRHSNTLFHNEYDASDRVKTITLSFQSENDELATEKR